MMIIDYEYPTSTINTPLCQMSYTLNLSLTLYLSCSLSHISNLFYRFRHTPMSTMNHLFDLPDQICYIQCGFCTTILMVSVPCSSMSMVVTVRCGHCTSLLSVNMMKASFVPLHLLASLSNLEPKECSPEEDMNKTLNNSNASMMTYSDCEEEDVIPINNVVNKPPEKRQRTPSAYNRFIKEEIKRLKAEHPDMAHKEAFSTAAKNWANSPPTQCKGDEESCSQTEPLLDLDSHLDPNDAEVNEEGQGFRGRKVPRNSILGRMPFN
ncbi:PREDICTED: axial regulator YABBY 4-like isoform X1 [Lupinus angustifolius]|nr:PREDICTED: axial regulator YABBY 4-like isoform X1 [Lupinus angustifolius]